MAVFLHYTVSRRSDPPQCRMWDRNERWLKKPLSPLAGVGYELRQMFELRYLKSEVEKA